MDYIQRLRPFSNKEVNRAAAQLATAPKDSEAFREARELVSNWRSLHEGPVAQFRDVLEHIATGIDPQSLVVSRLKRIPTIIDKLKRQPTMKLSTMQDIGGLRAVVGSVPDVRALADGLRDLRDILPGFELKTTKDYIQNPASSGYRGLHLVYQYRSQGDEDRNLDGLRIEVQTRTRLQHVWATAVEMVGNLRGESLKSGEGSPEWLELFRLAGNVVEARQRLLSRLPKLPPDLVALRDRLRVMDRMRFYGAAIRGINYGLEYDKDALYFLIVLNLDRENPTVEVTGFPPRAFEQAVGRYRDEEQKSVGKPVDVVLVSAESPEDLREAYPNYFAETGDFINLVYAEDFEPPDEEDSSP